MKSAFRTAWPYLRKYRRGLAVGGAALVMKDALGVLMPLAIKAGIDTVTSGAPLWRLWRSAVLQ